MVEGQNNFNMKKLIPSQGDSKSEFTGEAAKIHRAHVDLKTVFLVGDRQYWVGPQNTFEQVATRNAGILRIWRLVNVFMTRRIRYCDLRLRRPRVRERAITKYDMQVINRMKLGLRLDIINGTLKPTDMAINLPDVFSNKYNKDKWQNPDNHPVVEIDIIKGDDTTAVTEHPIRAVIDMSDTEVKERIEKFYNTYSRMGVWPNDTKISYKDVADMLFNYSSLMAVEDMTPWPPTLLNDQWETVMTQLTEQSKQYAETHPEDEEDRPKQEVITLDAPVL